MKSLLKLEALIAVCFFMAIGAFVYGTFTAVAHAGPGRKSDLVEYMRYLNGSPRKLGVITGNAATAQNNTNTAVPFTISRGAVIFAVCDVDSFCIERGPSGAAATSSYTSSAMGFPLTASKPYPFMMKGGVGDVDLFSCIATANWNCAIFEMD